MKTSTLLLGACLVAVCTSCMDGSKTNDAAADEAQAASTDTAAIVASEDDVVLGEMQSHTYEGLLPAASCPGIEYRLTIRHREHSGDGTFELTLNYKEADDGQDKAFTYMGKRLTLRGIPGNDNATVWQCITEDGRETFNFLREDDTTITLLNDKCEKAQSQLNYSLKLVE